LGSENINGTSGCCSPLNCTWDDYCGW
jgi:hypothetical protein